MKPTVLIVDDEKHSREGLRAAFDDKYECFVAKDAAEAARLMQDVPPDAVLTDLRMAGEDGMAVIDRALKLGIHRNGVSPHHRHAHTGRGDF